MRSLFFVLALISAVYQSQASDPYFATGIRIGEVDVDSAIVWVRLTRDVKRVHFGAPNAQ